MERDITAIKKGLRRIDEGGLNRIMHHGRHGFIVISANRSEIYSSNKELDLTPSYLEWCKENNTDAADKDNMDRWLRNRNKTADAKLLAELKGSPFAFTPVYGGYHGSDDVSDSFEPSYIVYCHGKQSSEQYYPWKKLYDFALELTKKYGQDAVYVQAPNEAPIYVDMNGNKSNNNESKNFKFNDMTQMFFTTAKREKRTTGMHGLDTQPQRFTADIQFESMYRNAGASTYFDRMKRRKLGEIFIDE